MIPKPTPARPDTMTIREMCDAFDVTPRTLRFYEQKELLFPIRQGTKRLFTRRDRARLKLILRGKRFGFSLEDIRQLLDLYDRDGTQEAQLSRTYDLARERLQVLEQEIMSKLVVDAVKDAKHLQKNLSRLLTDGEPAVSAAYADLRRQLLWVLREMRAISLLDLPAEALRARLELFDNQAASFDAAFRERLQTLKRFFEIGSAAKSIEINLEVAYEAHD